MRRDEEDYYDGEDGDERAARKLDEEKIISELEEGGTVARRIEPYEKRQAQLDLMRLIIKCFNGDALGAAEAGTGVGKSFAYLLPAVRFASLNDERVVISTASITLQEQLFYKDIPLVLKATGSPVRAVLVKGRGNFLCLRRLNGSEDGAGSLFGGAGSADETQLEKIRTWAKTTESGSKTDLPFMPEERVWSAVCSESDTCLNAKCPFYEDCFVMKVRRAAAKAHIIVVNHHLLFADLAARFENDAYNSTFVLPPYKRVIIDEAHTIENSASSFFSCEWSKFSLLRQLFKLYRKRGTQESGLLLKLRAFGGFAKGSQAEVLTETWQRSIERISEAAERLEKQGLELCSYESVFRLVPGRDKIIQSRLTGGLLILRDVIVDFCRLIDDFIDEVKLEKGSADDGVKQAIDALVLEIQSARGKIAGIAEVAGAFTMYKSREDEVMWIERRTGRGGDWAMWTEAPVNIAGKLAGALFSGFKTVVCLSATLTVAGRFDYWAGRTGITMARQPEEGGADAGDYEDDRDVGGPGGGRKNDSRSGGHGSADKNYRPVLFGVFNSPFPYSRCVLLCTPNDAPLSTSDYARYNEFVQNAVLRLILSAGGGALILFTSFESLNNAYNYAADELKKAGILAFKQGDDDRSRLLKRFIEDEGSVLFATDSFWEGVDAPGGTLRLVVLCKLPFKSPVDPLFAARCETLERAGRNPFMELSIPEAVMKFRQGFGRLIRRSNDRGVVAVLDSRILKKTYGQIFLQSLPGTKINRDSLESVLQAASNFLASAPSPRQAA